MTPPSKFTLSQSLKNQERQVFYESHKDLAKVMILIVFFFPLFGVYISGLLGAAIGMLISILAYFLTPYIRQKLGE